MRRVASEISVSESLAASQHAVRNRFEDERAEWRAPVRPEGSDDRLYMLQKQATFSSHSTTGPLNVLRSELPSTDLLADHLQEVLITAQDVDGLVRR